MATISDAPTTPIGGRSASLRLMMIGPIAYPTATSMTAPTANRSSNLMSKPTRQATPANPMTRPRIRRRSNRSWPVAVRMMAAIIGTTASSNPAVELFRVVSACPSRNHGPLISTTV